MGSLVKGMEAPRDRKVVKVPTRQPTMPIPMRNRGYDEHLEECYEEDAQYVGLLGGIEEHTTEQYMPDVGSPPEGYDFHEEIDEYEATALNVLMDLREEETKDDKSIGEAIQLQPIYLRSSRAESCR